MKKTLIGIYIFTILILLITPSSTIVSAQTKSADVDAQQASGGSTTVYFPLVFNARPQSEFRVNAPLLDTTDWIAPMSIFWFGKVSTYDNYVDVRVGYTATALTLRFAVLDRYLWYDESPTLQELTQYDAAVVYLNTRGVAGSAPDANTYQFVAQQSPFGQADYSSYMAAYRGNGSGWQPANIPFEIEPSYRGDTGFNNEGYNKGWVLTYTIPFSSLGMSGAPADGTIWGIATRIFDRDNSWGAVTATAWPPEMNPDIPAAWAELGFGMPPYIPNSYMNERNIIIRQGLNAVNVPDASVGGSTVCGAGSDFNNWGDKPESDYADATVNNTQFNIQNQADVSDWPCFAKYYVTFPLDALPQGKLIISAKLVLYQFGNAGDPGDARPSFIQVLTAHSDWDESTLTWNNSPLAGENLDIAIIEPITEDPGILGLQREWSVSAAVARAYQDGQPLRLVLYSADSSRHSGKYFWASNRKEEPTARPTLVITYGDPTW